jgi:hypothetical protein
MDKREVPSDVDYKSKQEETAVTLSQKSDVIEGHEHGHSYSKRGQDVGMPESLIRSIVIYAREMKEKDKVASAFCGLQTSRVEELYFYHM